MKAEESEKVECQRFYGCQVYSTMYGEGAVYLLIIKKIFMALLNGLKIFDICRYIHFFKLST